MHQSNSSRKEPIGDYRLRPLWRWVVGIAGALAAIAIVLIVRHHRDPGSEAALTPDKTVSEPAANASIEGTVQRQTGEDRGAARGKPSAEEVVARKVAQLTQKRRDLVHAIAAPSGKTIPPE